MALVPRGDTPGFAQQGSIDWVSLAKAPVTFSLEVLARYSKAGIDALTVATGQAICSYFILPSKVERDVLDQLSKLPCVSMYGKVAWFGFGLRHVLYDLIDREGGLACLSLCGCLSESYDSFFAAQVLRALCRCRDMPPQLSPGIQTWQALLKPCAGIFSATKFRHLLDGFTRILGPRSAGGIEECTPTAAEPLAQVLLLLGQLSRKTLESCTFSGGIDCAWVAAVAEFVFRLSVDIRTSDGEYLHRSSRGRRIPSGEAQVIVLREVEASESTKIVGRCFRLPDGRSLLREDTATRSLDSAFLSFMLRSPWEHIIGDSFGIAARNLLQDPVGQDFAIFLAYVAGRPAGSTSRTHTLENGELYAWPSMRFNTSSPSGPDLLRFAAKRLPELQPCFEHIDENTHSISEDDVVSHVKAMRNACTCVACLRRRAGDNSDTKIVTESLDICLPLLAGTIVEYISLLSTVIVHPDVLPSPFGIREIYRNVSTGNMHHDHNVWQTFQLFSNLKKINGEPSDVDAVARSGGGICCYSLVLTAINIEPVSAAVHQIMPGHVEYDGNLFETLVSLHPTGKITCLLSEVFATGRRFDLFVSETRNPNTLEVAYLTKDSSRGYPCMISLRDVMHSAAHPKSVSRPYCGPGTDFLTFREKVGSARAPDFQEDLWGFSLPSPQAEVNPSGHSCKSTATSPSKYSLIVFIMDHSEPIGLEIHKSSVELWDKPDFGFEQLYAGYTLYTGYMQARGERSYATYHRNGQAHLAQVSDCPRCIVTYVSSTYPETRLATEKFFSVHSRTHVRGQIILHTGNQKTTTMDFDLRRLCTASQQLKMSRKDYSPLLHSLQY